MFSSEKREELSSSSLDQTPTVNVYETPIPNFSMRAYVFSSRNKGTGLNNWPFPPEFFNVCLNSGIKDPLPPFNSPDSNQMHSISNEPSSSYQVHSHVTDQNPLKPTNPIRGSCKSVVKRGSSDPVAISVDGSDLIMASKTCPVCKVFSSTSNTTLNAHIDQCLSIEATSDATKITGTNIGQFVEGQFAQKKVKPRKKRLMVEIYDTAAHGTIEDLDRRNGTNWTDELALPKDPICNETQEDKICTNIGFSRGIGDKGAVYVDSNGVKIRILSKLNDAPKKTRKFGLKSSNLNKPKLHKRRFAQARLKMGARRQRQQRNPNFSKNAAMPTTSGSHSVHSLRYTHRNWNDREKHSFEPFSGDSLIPNDQTREVWYKGSAVCRKFRKQRSALRTVSQRSGCSWFRGVRDNYYRGSEREANDSPSLTTGTMHNMPEEQLEEVAISQQLHESVPAGHNGVIQLEVETETRTEERGFPFPFPFPRKIASTAEREELRWEGCYKSGEKEEKVKKSNTDKPKPVSVSVCGAYDFKGSILNSNSDEKRKELSKPFIGPSARSSFTPYQSIKSNPNPNPNLNSGPSNSSNPTFRLMGKNLTINSTHQQVNVIPQNAPNRNHTIDLGFVGTEYRAMVTNTQITLPCTTLQPNFSSLPQMPSYNFVGRSHAPVQPEFCFWPEGEMVTRGDGSDRSGLLFCGMFPNQRMVVGSSVTTGSGSESGGFRPRTGQVLFRVNPPMYYPHTLL